MLSILLLAVVGMSQAAAPVGDTVWLYSVSTDSYVTMEPSNGNWLAAKNVSTVGTNEQFVVEDAGSGNILLKSVVNSNYVKADLDDAKKLKANTTSNTDTLAHFEWIELGDGKIRLKNIGNGLNIRPRGAALVLRANTTATEIETEFTWGIVGAVDPTVQPLDARVSVFNAFTDNMVLQRDEIVAVYGEADPGDEITVVFADQTSFATTGHDGKWITYLDPMAASFTPRTLSVSDASIAVSITNVLVGDVWLASGQSNMDHPFSTYSQLSTSGKDNPNIRLLLGEHVTAEDPQEAPVIASAHNGSWQECRAAYLETFSPTAYFFGAKLQADLNVPIGLIESAWGGTIAEAWTPLGKLQELGYEVDNIAIDSDTGEPSQHNQSVLYNAMIHPYRDFTFKGFIWYQGESNTNRAVAYASLFPGMIESWRDAFGRGDLPFYFVQLAPYQTLSWNLEGAAWAWLRDSQTQTLALTNTGMAVTTDLGEYLDIHPQNKQPVGERLALHALKAEGWNIVASSPMYSGMQVSNNQIIISFANAASGLQTQEVVMNSNANYAVGMDPDAFVVPSDSVAGFQICGADEVFVDAQASINGNEVAVWAASVPNPVAVRYGWANFPLCNLFSAEGLPASPFRTDAFEAPIFTGAIKGDVFSGSEGDLGEVMVFRSNFTGSVTVPTNIAGRSGYHISASPGKRTRYAYYKTENPDLKNGQTPGIAVEILYFDTGSGEFTFKYDSSDQTFQQGEKPIGVWKPAGTNIALTDSGVWRVATIVLDDAWFANRCQGYDLRVQTNETDLILGGVYLTPFPVLQAGIFPKMLMKR